jgi:ERCC4-related helicase
MKDIYSPPEALMLGQRINQRVPRADQERQRAEVEGILHRLRTQPGVILADEVGMGKTFVALAIAYSIAVRSPKGPVIVMVPSNLVDKWKQDLATFCELYLDGRRAVNRDGATEEDLADRAALRYGVALHSVDLLKLLDDTPRARCHVIFLAQRAMSRRQTDKWIRLALIAEALRRHGRGKASRLIQVKEQIHRFLAEFIYARGEERGQHLGDALWQRLLRTDPESWKDIYNSAARDEQRHLLDDPVPKVVVRALRDIDLNPLAEALEQLPVRARGGDRRVTERLEPARRALRDVERDLWKEVIAKARWRSPLLVMDEAHHLKNPDTALARQFKAADIDQDLRTGDAAMANVFDRILFLTATPFQLGHHELVQVLKRFGDVRRDAWELGDRDAFEAKMSDLWQRLDDSQRAAIALQRSWNRLQPEDCSGDPEEWWKQLLEAARESLTHRQRAAVEAYEAARRTRDAAEQALRPWVVRHNKGTYWADSTITRRQRVDGAAIAGQEVSRGLQIPPRQLLPFFLAARSVVRAGQDLLGEALCSSFEAFRWTRLKREDDKDALDDEDQPQASPQDLSHAGWYLKEFDQALKETSGATHPKMFATVMKVADLWEAGEKVLVFAFYRQTCRALRLHISQEIERRVLATAQRRLGGAGRESDRRAVDQLLEGIQRRFFDDSKSPGRKALDRALHEIINRHARRLGDAGVARDQREALADVMRRFLRVTTTLVRSFPIEDYESLKPAEAVAKALDQADGSGTSWRQKFDGFIDFIVECSTEERRLFLEATQRTQTGGIRVEDDDSEDSAVTLANVQVATGVTKRDTRARLMRAFNTPFFPDILVCSEVMGEGVDLQRFCRHVIHHDLAWNPSTIEQRTGRIDRLACKAEGRHPIVVYLPYLAGTADERQYQVMSDRERWFRVVMGQEEVAKLITPDSSIGVRLPETVSNELGFKLGLEGPRPADASR